MGRGRSWFFLFVFVLNSSNIGYAEQAEEVSQDGLKAISKGLKYLSESILPNGYWNDSNIEKFPFYDSFWRNQKYPIAQTALAGTAFLANGHTPRTGQYHGIVEKIVNYFLVNEERNNQGMYAAADPTPMFGQGFAILFLSQCFGMLGDGDLHERLRNSLKRAIEKIRKSQWPSGGFSYYYDHKGGWDEATATVVQIQALRAARDAGFLIPEETLEKAQSYIERSLLPQGGMRYSLTYTSITNVTTALNSAGLGILHAMGQYSGEKYEKLLKMIRSQMKEANYDVGRILIKDSSFTYHFTMFYLTQALYQVGGPDWNNYYPNLSKLLVSTQEKSGSWDSDYGRVYGTAMSILSLSVPLEFLPRFER